MHLHGVTSSFIVRKAPGSGNESLSDPAKRRAFNGNVFIGFSLAASPVPSLDDWALWFDRSSSITAGAATKVDGVILFE